MSSAATACIGWMLSEKLATFQNTYEDRSTGVPCMLALHTLARFNFRVCVRLASASDCSGILERAFLHPKFLPFFDTADICASASAKRKELVIDTLTVPIKHSTLKTT